MIKLMSFNIRYSLADDGENRWERRKSLVIERIQAFDPDLLGLQECRDDSQAEFIKSNLEDYEFFGMPRGGDRVTASEMAPILVKRSTFIVKQWDAFWLSETPYIPGSKSWGSVFPRTATWVKLIHQVRGRSLTLLNTHFDYEPSAIQGSALLLNEWIDEAIGPHPLLVTGDFNADKNSSAYRLLTSGSPVRKDVFRTGPVENENEGTFHGYGTAIPPQAIDWVLATDHFAILQTGIDRYQEGKLFPSDHYPLMATIDWMNPTW